MNTFSIAEAPTICTYCRKQRPFSADLHGCPQSVAAMKRLATVIESIERSQALPGIRELSSNDMKLREDRRRETATALALKGLPVRPEYQPNGNI